VNGSVELVPSLPSRVSKFNTPAQVLSGPTVLAPFQKNRTESAQHQNKTCCFSTYLYVQRTHLALCGRAPLFHAEGRTLQGIPSYSYSIDFIPLHGTVPTAQVYG
ncbi:MAG: hypothetical protein EZS28_049049, partial [Streblomastix strix]